MPIGTKNGSTFRNRQIIYTVCFVAYLCSIAWGFFSIAANYKNANEKAYTKHSMKIIVQVYAFDTFLWLLDCTTCLIEFTIGIPSNVLLNAFPMLFRTAWNPYSAIWRTHFLCSQLPKIRGINKQTHSSHEKRWLNWDLYLLWEITISLSRMKLKCFM